MMMVIGMGVGTMMLCLLIQVWLLLAASRYYVRHLYLLGGESFRTGIRVVAVFMLVLVLGNLIQGGIWAALFLWLDEFDNWRAAYYHSMVNFATLGYGDIVMSERWRLLGPLEALNGVLMIGVTTASLGSVIQDALKRFWQAHNEEVNE